MIGFLHRLGADFWPLDRSFVGPNLVADVVHWLIIGLVAYLVWPRFHRTVDAWVRRHLHNHHLLHVAPHHDAMAEAVAGLHQKLDHLIAISTHQAKETAMGIIQDIEVRFGYKAASDPNISNAHVVAGQILVDAATAIAELTPVGAEVESAFHKLEEVAHWVHAAIDRHPEAVVVPAPSSAPVEPIPAPAVSPNVPAAPVAEPAPVVDPPAPVADPTQADTTVVQPDVTAAPAADVPEAPVAPSAPVEPVAPVDAPAAPVDPTVTAPADTTAGSTTGTDTWTDPAAPAAPPVA